MDKYSLIEQNGSIELKNTDDFTELIKGHIQRVNPVSTFLKGIEAYFGSIQSDEHIAIIEAILNFLPDSKCNIERFNALWIIYRETIQHIVNYTLKTIEKRELKNSNHWHRMLSYPNEKKRREFILKQFDDFAMFLDELFEDDNLVIFDPLNAPSYIDQIVIEKIGIRVKKLKEDIQILKRHYEHKNLNNYSNQPQRHKQHINKVIDKIREDGILSIKKDNIETLMIAIEKSYNLTLSKKEILGIQTAINTTC